MIRYYKISQLHYSSEFSAYWFSASCQCAELQYLTRLGHELHCCLRVFQSSTEYQYSQPRCGWNHLRKVCFWAVQIHTSCFTLLTGVALVNRSPPNWFPQRKIAQVQFGSEFQKGKKGLCVLVLWGGYCNCNRQMHHLPLRLHSILLHGGICEINWTERTKETKQPGPVFKIYFLFHFLCIYSLLPELAINAESKANQVYPLIYPTSPLCFCSCKFSSFKFLKATFCQSQPRLACQSDTALPSWFDWSFVFALA